MGRDPPIIFPQPRLSLSSNSPLGHTPLKDCVLSRVSEPISPPACHTVVGLNKFYRPVAALSVLALLPGQCGATTILFGESNGQTYLAADGLGTRMSFGTPTGETTPICK